MAGSRERVGERKGEVRRGRGEEKQDRGSEGDEGVGGEVERRRKWEEWHKSDGGIEKWKREKRSDVRRESEEEGERDWGRVRGRRRGCGRGKERERNK